MAKTSTRIPYYRAIELATMPNEQRQEYDKKYMDLRRNMRALIAYQDSRSDRPTIRKYISASNLKDYIPLATAKIMETFIGTETFKNVILPIYETSKESPIDHFDLYTAYHYFRFKEKLISIAQKEFHQARTSNPDNFVNLDFNSLLAKANEAYFGKSDINNMFVNRNWFKVNQPRIKSYTTITERQKKKLDKYHKLHPTATDQDCLDIAQLPCTFEIKSDILDYLFSHAEKNIDEKTAYRLRQAYTGTFAKNLPNLGLSTAAEEYLKGLYDFSGNLAVIIENLNSNPQTTVADNGATLPEIEDMAKEISGNTSNEEQTRETKEESQASLFDGDPKYMTHTTREKY